MKAAVWEDASLSLLRGVLYEEMTELFTWPSHGVSSGCAEGTAEKDCRRRE